MNSPQSVVLTGVRWFAPTSYEEGAEEQAKPSIKTIMTARLSADRRVADEATAALFLAALKHTIAKPQLTVAALIRR
jgi:pyruvate/2-oxoglutarate dehydrogenase complex dihydrolipoamide acyltransferase (E2) component